MLLWAYSLRSRFTEPPAGLNRSSTLLVLEFIICSRLSQPKRSKVRIRLTRPFVIWFDAAVLDGAPHTCFGERPHAADG